MSRITHWIAKRVSTLEQTLYSDHRPGALMRVLRGNARGPRDTCTGAVEVDVEAEFAFAVLADVANIPVWAPAFADTVVPILGVDEYEASKDATTFRLRFVTRADSGTIDVLRPIFPGRDSGASIRVLPGPRAGCVVTLTLPVPPGADGDSVASTLAVELSAISDLVGGRATAVRARGDAENRPNASRSTSATAPVDVRVRRACASLLAVCRAAENEAPTIWWPCASTRSASVAEAGSDTDGPEVPRCAPQGGRGTRPRTG